MTLEELRQVTDTLGMPPFTARQLAEWIYRRQVATIDGMSNISQANREKLKAQYTVGVGEPLHCQRSADGTVKYLFPVSNGGMVETVYIPDDDRATLCVSSQVGCKMNCRFCMTGRQGFSGNLTPADILNQIHALPERDTLTNVVFMGQGEPFDNLDAVLRATELLTASYAYAWSPKRITVSSVGLRKGLERFLEESQCHLAISLHNPFPLQRAEMMPAERSFGIQQVVDVLSRYDFSHQRRLSFEYILFDGLNHTKAHADALLKLLRPLQCRVNLIPFHDVPGTSFRGLAMPQMLEFRDYLTRHGLFTTIRASRGQDIQAACGLLNTAQQNKQQDNIPS